MFLNLGLASNENIQGFLFMEHLTLHRFIIRKRKMNVLQIMRSILTPLHSRYNIIIFTYGVFHQIHIPLNFIK